MQSCCHRHSLSNIQEETRNWKLSTKCVYNSALGGSPWLFLSLDSNCIDCAYWPPASSSRVDLCRKAGAGFIAASWWPLSRGGVSDTTIPRQCDQNPKTFCSFFFNSSDCMNFLSELCEGLCFCFFVLFLRQHDSAVGSHWCIWLRLFKCQKTLFIFLSSQGANKIKFVFVTWSTSAWDTPSQCLPQWERKGYEGEGWKKKVLHQELTAVLPTDACRITRTERSHGFSKSQTINSPRFGSVLNAQTVRSAGL